MTTLDLMTAQEIHDFGIESVCTQITKDGYLVEGINSDLKESPSIIARKNDNLIFITVRTECYPKKGEIKTKDEFVSILQNAQKHNALPYFASVGICNANSKDEKEAGTPIKGAPYHILFNGLLLMGDANKASVFNQENVTSKSSKAFNNYIDKIISSPILLLTSLFLLAIIIDSVAEAWGERRFLKAFIESFLALFIHWFFIIGSFAGGIYTGYKVTSHTKKQWLGWIAGIMVFGVIVWLSTYAYELDGIGWRLQKINNTNTYEY